MNALESLLERISCFLNSRKQAWALVGGLAVSIRTEPRFTRDLDLAVAVDNDQEAEALVHALHHDGFQTFATVEHEKTKRLATARIMPAGDSPQGLVLDILFASSGIEDDVCRNAENLLVFPNLHVPVAQTYHLIALKILSRDDETRPQDAADLRQLIAHADETDLESARVAAKLIAKRGFNRERNLIEAINHAWDTFRT